LSSSYGEVWTKDSEERNESIRPSVLIMKRGCILLLCSAIAAIGLAACNANLGPTDSALPVLADFDFLELGMSYDKLISEVGEADRDIGSGIHLMVYPLQDGTELILSFPSFDNLTAVHHYDPESDERQLILG